MKKTDYILIGVVALIIILSIFVVKGTNKEEKTNVEKVSLVGDAGLVKVGYGDYDTSIKNGEGQLIIIERTGCTYCEKYMPIAEEVAKEKNIPIRYMDIAEISEDELTSLTTSNSYFKKNTEWGTPTTLLMNGSNVIDSISGYVEKDKLNEFIDKNVNLG